MPKRCPFLYSTFHYRINQVYIKSLSSILLTPLNLANRTTLFLPHTRVLFFKRTPTDHTSPPRTTEHGTTTHLFTSSLSQEQILPSFPPSSSKTDQPNKILFNPSFLHRSIPLVPEWPLFGQFPPSFSCAGLVFGVLVI